MARAVCLAGILLFPAMGQGRPPDDADRKNPFSEIGVEWGGHLRTIGTVSAINEDSIYQFADTGPYYDGQIELRLKNRMYLGPRWTLQTHYELVAPAGDTHENNRILQRMFPSVPTEVPFFSQTINDDRRLFNLTHVLTEEDRYLVYHRLDRLNLTYTADQGTLRLGRQALTWGDGLVFNPMDLFNPFAPTSVQRDYKIGDDMIHLQLPTGRSEMQFLFLPRRDPQTGELQDDQSSYALKFHTTKGSLEMDIMAARHYDDPIVGLGASGYLGGAAWRINTVYTAVAEENGQDDFWQIVANVDYAWIWGGRNVYGLLEFYYNGLGLTGDYDQIVADQPLIEKLARGELYTIGRYYLAGQVQIELHPLVQFHTTAIINLSDPSGVLQPQVVWDLADNLQILAGGQWYWGAGGSEYGGYDVRVADTIVNMAPADQFYIWFTYYY